MSVRDRQVLSMPSRRRLVRQGAAMFGMGAIAPSVVPATQSAPVGHVDVTAFGATRLQADSATKAFQGAIDACTAAGGGTVSVPPGAYTVGMIQLKDNVTLE